MFMISSVIAVMAAACLTVSAAPTPNATETTLVKRQTYELFFWSDYYCNDNRVEETGSGTTGCNAMTFGCMTGTLSATGATAGGANVCIYSNSDCTGDTDGYNDCASCDQAQLYVNNNFEYANSWIIKDGDC